MNRFKLWTRAIPVAALLLAGGLTAQADESEAYREIREKLLSQNLEDLDAASELFAQALAEYPDSAQIKSLHMLFSSRQLRANRPVEAAKHAEAVVDLFLDNVKESPSYADGFAAMVEQVTHAYRLADEPQKAIDKLQEIVAKVQAIEDELDDPQIEGLVAQLEAKQAVLLSQCGKLEEAQSLLADLHDRARKDFESSPDDAGKVLALANVLAVRGELGADEEAVAAARTEHRQFMVEQAKKHVESLPIVSAYVNAQMKDISSSYRVDAAKAEADLKELEDVLATLESADEGVQRLVTSMEGTLGSLKRAIESAKIQQALIGQPAFPLDAHAWVNGDPLSDGDLKGKVVLIDFWAVWCGPCIATFPHLREWHDKYTDRGFVIIGATRHYGYDWDVQTKSIHRVADLAPEVEEAALVPFAEHHLLKHRFMIMPDESDFSQNYGVTGIPTAILIDRDGIVQMIRVGSGEANAHDLQEKIEELVLDPASQAGGG